MQHKVPPIQWLPVFEAAARLLSFKKAAEELCVTPPAVSQQIKVLEDYMGVNLFDRSGRRLKLSYAGEYYYRIVSSIIKSHMKGYRDFERIFQHPMLQVSAPLFIAQELLIPNYMGFRKKSPSTELRLMTGSDYVDFDSDPVDAAIRFGEADWPELDCRLLCQVELNIMCSSTYLTERGINQDDYLSINDLQQQVVLSTSSQLNDWRGLIPEMDPADKIICDSYFSMIKSVEQGLGVGIGLLPVINHWLRDERVIPLNTDHFETRAAYWLVAPKDSVSPTLIDQFYEWSKELFEQLAP